MYTKTVTIAGDLIPILESMEWKEVNGKVHGVIAAKVDRKTYVRVAKVLGNLGGKWNRKAKATIFADDPRPAIAQAAAAGKMTVEVDDFYETPAWMGNEMLARLGEIRGKKVCEPSAGTGALARLAREAGAVDIYCIEPNEKRAAILRDSGFRVKVADFLETGGKYDIFLMNPPFSKGQDARHILHAFSLLKRGGKLAAVASAGVKFRTDGPYGELADLIEECGTIFDNPPDAFRDQGTGVNTVQVYLQKL